MNKLTSRAYQSGFSMIEVLITLIIILIGLLGIAALQARATMLELESYQRAQALILMSDIVDRININRSTVSCFNLSNATTGADFIGTGYAGGHTCTASTPAYNTQTVAAITAIDNLLKGAAETSGGASVGAMIGARACISYDAATETGVAGSGLYTIAVSWQSMMDLNVPAVNCGNGLYGDETKRRTVSSALRIAELD
ncbi:MAG: type IV pilus assembly protein PilV [Gammaproteobacteria bacterium]|jgi:type IV pilus assembly protein PilV